MKKAISYLLATLLCLSGCVATTITTQPIEKITKKYYPKPPGPFTYLLADLWIDPYPFVGSINYSEDDSLIGTGVLISSNLVLTAAHVPENKEDLAWVEHDGDKICIEEVIYYPEHIVGMYGMHDVAIMVLEYESDEFPVNLIDSNDYIYKRMPVTTVGHGHGIKRYSNPGIFWYYGRLVSNPQFMIMLPLKASIWFGDSGGAVLTNENKLIGIMSYFSVKEGVIFENGCVSIEFYKDWIEEIKNERLLERMDT